MKSRRQRQRSEPQRRSPGSQRDSRSGTAGPICFHFRDTGSCPFGDRCRFQHEQPRSGRSSGRSSGHSFGRSGSGGSSRRDSSRRSSRDRSRKRSRSPEPPASSSRSSGSRDQETTQLLNQILANQRSSRPSSGGLSEYVRSQRDMVRQIMSEQNVGEQEATDALNSITSQ